MAIFNRLRNVDKDGNDGEWITYLANDTIGFRSFYVKGIKTGSSINYYPNGRIESEEFYDDKGISIQNHWL